jgi:large subunit ribosomal protein L19
VSGQIIKDFEAKYKSKNSLNFKVGDTIRVFSKIIEGEKERVQTFSGIVVAIKGQGLSQTFTLYRNAYGSSMERVFLLHSPRITKIDIEKKGKVRKSKLYYLRGQSGKKAKVSEQLYTKEASSEVPNVLLQEPAVLEQMIDQQSEDTTQEEIMADSKEKSSKKKKSEETESEKPKKKVSKKEKSEDK